MAVQEATEFHGRRPRDQVQQRVGDAWILDPDHNKVELWEPMVWDAKNKR